MIVSHKQRLIFIKPRKVGGTSVYLNLAQQCGETDLLSYLSPFDDNIDESKYNTLSTPERRWFNGQKITGHMSAEKAKAILGELWDSYDKLSIVRNPWDVEISRYFWMIANEDIPQCSFRNYMIEHYPKCSRSNDPYFFIDGSMVIDWILRYESLEKDYKVFCEEFGLEWERLPRTKTKVRPKRGRYQEYYDAESVEIVRRDNQLTIDHFGYEFGR